MTRQEEIYFSAVSKQKPYPINGNEMSPRIILREDIVVNFGGKATPARTFSHTVTELSRSSHGALRKFNQDISRGLLTVHHPFQSTHRNFCRTGCPPAVLGRSVCNIGLFGTMSPLIPD